MVDPDPEPRSRLSQVAAGLRDVYSGPYRRTFARAQPDEDDLVLVIVMAEALGVPNPASYYTVELLPIVYEQFHDWHQRVGLDRSPLDHFSCC